MTPAELAERARLVFGDYAAMDAPDLPPGRWQSAQTRHHRWQSESFGAHPATSFVLGIVEEVCDELMDGIMRDDRPAIIDACADALIFGTGLCTLCRLDVGVIAEESVKRKGAGFDELGLVRVVGQLAHATLKNAQRIRGMSDEAYRERVCDLMCELWRMLLGVGRVYGFDIAAEYFATLDEVLKRDWRRDPTAGGQTT